MYELKYNLKLNKIFLNKEVTKRLFLVFLIYIFLYFLFPHSYNYPVLFLLSLKTKCKECCKKFNCTCKTNSSHYIISGNTNKLLYTQCKSTESSCNANKPYIMVLNVIWVLQDPLFISQSDMQLVILLLRLNGERTLMRYAQQET